MANIGSAFLGDARRIRQLSSPTTTTAPTSPPSSPPAHNTHPMSLAQPLSPPPTQSHSPQPDSQGWAALAQPLSKTTIDSALALELRVRWLEALVLGLDDPALDLDAPTSADKASADKGHKIRGSLRRGQKAKEKERGKEKETVVTLARLTEDVKKRLDAIVDTNEGLRKFMDTYDQHAQYLTPTFALSGIIDAPLPSTPTSESAEGGRNLSLSLLPIYENMSPAELEAYLTEMEPEIRAADRDMREIEALVGKGATGAGKLGDYEALKPRLAKLIKAHQDDVKLADELEKRVTRLVERHVTHVDALSELFVAWDDTLLEAESRTSRLEKDGRERQRLGLVVE